MKKKILLTICFIFVLSLGVLIGTNFSKEDVYEEDSYVPEVTHKNMLSMMLEQNAGVGDYSLETRSSWPTKEDGYIFNPTLSKCEKGSKLSWDDENNLVLMEGTTSDKCYVYFDVYHPPVTLAVWVKGQYTTQGANNLYYHDSTLENGANDNSYRYAGSSDTTNNFVCFGSDESTCPDDNLYRIIGVFGDQVKLIKWDYATSDLLGTDGDYSADYVSETSLDKGNYTPGTSNGTNVQTVIGAYYWNHDGTDYGTNTWSASKLNIVNLNTNFLTNIGTTWANKITTIIWKVGGNTLDNIYSATAANAYKNEYVNPAESSTETAKIGLMYTSDYGFAASPNAWTSNLSNYNFYINENWMYMGLLEWTVVRCSANTISALRVDSSGLISYNGVGNFARAIRPVFYLNSDVSYVSGSGTKEDSIRIN